jgi:hypothetical protein
MEAFLVSAGVVALGEIGDKTQLLALVLAARFRKPWPIVAGILVAMGDKTQAAATRIPFKAVRIAAALLFVALGVYVLLAPGTAAAAGVATAPAEERGNLFGDPFVQVTSGMAGCPTPQGPMITPSEMHAEAHPRAERGTRCYESGRCRLPNSYLYDKEIIPRVQKAILADGRFAATSVWAEGQRRWVTLKGCVRTRAEADALGRLVRGIDDVEAVVDALVVKRR